MMRELLLSTVLLASVPVSFGQTSQAGRITNDPVAGREDFDSSHAADVRRFGVRSIRNNQPPAVPGCTATISSGSANASLSSVCGFADNDGVIIYGAGINNPIGTPVISSVTPSVPEALTGSFATVVSQRGSTRYSYCASAWNPGAAKSTNPGTSETACSAEFSITNGLASLGPQPGVAISSITCKGIICTVTTLASQSLAAGGAFTISGAVPASFNGLRNVTKWTDSTHFTYKNPNLSTLDDGPASATTPGTMYYAVSNTIVVNKAAGSPDGTRYIIYRSGPGGGGVIACITLPQYESQQRNFWYNTCEDYGATYSPSPTLPFYIATTAPSSATNEGLRTYITTGGGTTVVALNEVSVNTVAGNTILYDAGVGLERAGAAQIALGTSRTKVSIPTPNVAQSFYINAPTVLPNVGYVFRGGVVLQDTLYPGAMLQGDPMGFYQLPSFAYNSYIGITCAKAWPCIQTKPDASFNFQGFQLSIPESGIGILSESSAMPSTYINDVYMSPAGKGYTTIDHVIVGTGGAGAITLDSYGWNGSQLGTGSMTTPGMLIMGGPTAINFKQLSLSGKGIAWYASSSTTGMNLSFTNSVYIQGPYTPIVTLLNNADGAQQSNITFTSTCNDTGTNRSWISSLQGTNTVQLTLTPGASCAATGATNLVTTSGGNVTFVNVPNINASSGVLTEPTGSAAAAYGAGANAIWNGGNINGAFVHAYDFGTDVDTSAGHTLYVRGYTPPAPTCAVQSGGSIPVNTYYLIYVPIMETGNGGTASNYCKFATSSGNQAVQVSFIPIVGAKGYSVYMQTSPRGFDRVNVALITSLPYTLRSASFQGDVYGRPMDGTIGGANGLWHAQKIAVGRSTFQKATDTQESAVTVPDIAAYSLAAEIASGTATMPTSDITAGACGTTITVPAPNTKTTDTITISSNASVTTPNGLLIINFWPTANYVNFRYCNPSVSGQTPTPNTINWRVIR